ncbi:hypothetical protein QOT17_015232 [Balamuthia mandrillaris]
MDMPPAYLGFNSAMMNEQPRPAQEEVLAPPPSFTGLTCLLVEGHLPSQTPDFGVPFEMQEEDSAVLFGPQRQQQPQLQTSFYVAKQELCSPPYQAPVCLRNEMQPPRSNESVICYLQRDPNPAANNFYPSPPRRPEHEQPAHTSASYGRLNDRYERTSHETIQYRRSSYVIPITKKKKKKKKTSRPPTAHRCVDSQHLQSWVEDCKAFAPAQKLVGDKASLDVGGGLRYARPRRNKQKQAGCSHCTWKNVFIV